MARGPTCRSEVASRESETKYRSLFTSIDEGFCILELLRDADGKAYDLRYLETNPAFERQAGFAAPVGRTFREITGESPEPEWLELHEKVLRTGESAHMDGLLDATGRWYEISASRLGMPESRRLACVFKDITDRKRVEAMMQQALEREQTARAIAEEATRLRDDFIDVVSHELRTPLSAILIWAKALRTPAVRSSRMDEALDAISASAAAQQSLIEELLDMSRLVAGRIQIAVLDEDLRAVIEEVLAAVRPTAASRGVELRGEGLDAPVGALVDRARLHQVLWNVVGNAVKFTPSGGHVSVLLRSTAEKAVIEVVDDGRGIDPRFLPYVFDRFRQADMSQTRSAGGLGLGLCIARQIVEMHGGTITASSQGVGHGSTFRIELPRGAIGVSVPPRNTPVPPARGLAGRRILLVEDESHTRAVLTWLLESSGAEVVAVAHGSAAREAIELGAHFDALICDLGLPEEDGCALLQALRQSPGASMPAMALTAYVRQEDRDRARKAGFEVFMTKPITPERFIEAVAELSSGDSNAG